MERAARKKKQEALARIDIMKKRQAGEAPPDPPTREALEREQLEARYQAKRRALEKEIEAQEQKRAKLSPV